MRKPGISISTQHYMEFLACIIKNNLEGLKFRKVKKIFFNCQIILLSTKNTVYRLLTLIRFSKNVDIRSI